MTAVPETPALPGQKRVAADLPADVARRLRTWAALRGQPVSHVIGELVARGLPSIDELAAQMAGLATPTVVIRSGEAHGPHDSFRAGLAEEVPDGH